MWPCFVYAQAPIAAALEIRRRKNAPEEIEAITVDLTDTAYENQQAFLGEIRAREHADHSVSYAVARALLDGEVRVDDFDERRFKDPRALALINKVSLRADSSLTTPDVEGLGANLEVRFRNGVVERAKVPEPPGGLQNRADENSLIRKFTALSANILGKERSYRATEIILGAEKISDLKSLLVAVSAPARNIGRRPE
jgi:2-methylcitrate dehydratase